MSDYPSQINGPASANAPETWIHRRVQAIAELPARTLRVSLVTLAPAQSTARNRQSYEAILYVLEGEGTTFIEDDPLEWRAGDALYLPAWAWHYHWNGSTNRPCRFLSCENAPLLQSIGGVELREETRRRRSSQPHVGDRSNEPSTFFRPD